MKFSLEKSDGKKEKMKNYEKNDIVKTIQIYLKISFKFFI